MPPAKTPPTKKSGATANASSIERMTQKDKTSRGTSGEEIIIGILPQIGCRLEGRYKGGETLDGKGKSKKIGHHDLDIVCPPHRGNKTLRIEVKTAELLEPSKAGYRTGRISLAAATRKNQVAAWRDKDCYAMVIDDNYSDVMTIDFVKPTNIKPFFLANIKQYDEEEGEEKGGKQPKYPISFLMRERRVERCFNGVGTITIPKVRLGEFVDPEKVKCFKSKTGMVCMLERVKGITEGSE